MLVAAEPVAGVHTRLWTGWCSSCCAGDRPLQPQPHQGRRPGGQELGALSGLPYVWASGGKTYGLAVTGLRAGAIGRSPLPQLV